MNEPSASTAAGPASADRLGPRPFALLLALLIFAAFWNVLLGCGTFAARDFGLFSYPVASFHRQCFWRGEIPWWNPLNCCGLPFLAQFNTLVLYPLSLIYLLLPLPWSLPFFCLLHLFLGGMGMYFLAARWTGSRPGAALAGVVFAFNGLALNLLMWPSHIAAYAWIPWVICLTEKGWKNGGRALALAALAAAMQILAGGPEEILFAWLILLGIAAAECCRGTAAGAFLLLRRFLLTGALAVGLAAPLLLPFADFALHGNRSAQFGASDWAMPAWGWANFLAPEFQTGRMLGTTVQAGQYWTSSYYVGIEIIFLAAMACWRQRGWRVWLAAGYVAAALVLALGDQGLAYLWLRRLFPFVGFFRFPIKFVIVTSALFPLLAAFGMRQYENSPNRAPRSWRPEIMAFGGIVFLTGVILWFARFHPVGGSSWADTRGNALSRVALLALFLAVYTQPGSRRWSGLLLTLICWADLVSGVPWQNPMVDASVYQPNLGQLAAKLDPVPDPAESRLVMSSFAARRVNNQQTADVKTGYLLARSMFVSDCNLLDGLPKVDGFFSLYLRETDKVLWLLDDNSGPERARQLASLEDLLGVSQTIAPGKIYDWTPRKDYLPIVSAGQEPIFAGDQTAFNAIGQTNVNYRDVVYLPPEARAHVTASREPAARVISKVFAPNKDIIQIETPKPTMVFISQAYYHNWRAAVDGKPVPLWRANFAFQAVETPAGRHEITLVYKDTLFWIGTVLTIAAGLVCLALGRASNIQIDPPQA